MQSTDVRIELAQAKNKDFVPVINGKPLHSLHNPRKEAEALANNHLAQLSTTPNALVLGLGFGYHVIEIAHVLKLRHKTFRLIVIEANKEIYRLCQAYSILSESIQVFTHPNPESFFFDSQNALFMSQKPSIIIHRGSYDQSLSYYQKFLNYRPRTNPEDYRIAETLTPNKRDQLWSIYQEASRV